MRAVLIFVLFINTFSGVAQNCESNHFRFCMGCETPYKMGGQCQSIPVEIGQISSFHVLVYQGFDYCIQICASENFENVSFKIMEDDASHMLLYDSSVEDNKLNKEFVADRTKKLLIEIIVPDNPMNLNEKSEERMGCVDFVFKFNKNILNPDNSQKQGF